MCFSFMIYAINFVGEFRAYIMGHNTDISKDQLYFFLNLTCDYYKYIFTENIAGYYNITLAFIRS